MPLGHVSLATGPKHFKDMRDFYTAVLAPLGYTVFMQEDGKFCGLQINHNPDFWLHCGGEDFTKLDPSVAGIDEGRRGRTHVAFSASSRKQVDEWYRHAIKLGGIPNGGPGERIYAKGYYAAYVLDPLGNNVEAVFWNPLWLQALQAAPKLVPLILGGVLAQVAARYLRG